MILALTSYHYIIIFSLTIIISYFFNIYAKKTGIPSVLMLIGLGVLINYVLSSFIGVEKPNLFPILKVIGVFGLILIVLEAALDLSLVKEKVSLIIKSTLVALLGLVGTAYFSAEALVLFVEEMDIITGLIYTIPLSILSSAIILPSVEDLNENKKEFMIYESTISDILGIIAFYAVLSMVGADSNEGVYGEVFGNLVFTVIFSIIISYVLVYVFQNIAGHVKLFLLIAILLLLYAVGKMFHLSSLVMILIFGVILNNYKLFFSGGLASLLNMERVDHILNDMKVITAESAFVVRTFFFIIFGWSITISDLFSLKVIGIGICILFIIYIIRALFLFLFQGKDIFPQLFLAPRGLITILLFFAIPEETRNANEEIEGVLLFIILTTCLIMSWALVVQKNKEKLQKEILDQVKNESVDKDADLVEAPVAQKETENNIEE
ncbi:MAG: sodium:proton exchanger [Flavobacteriales bacterium]|mgnify:CR=1 FL=1|nr:sodium:proton exchanger [Flavobacteriales bacterium]